MTPPTLHTDRLILRPHRMDDFPAYANCLGSERAQYMDGPLDRSAAWAWFCDAVAHWPLFGFGELMVTRRDTGAAIGAVGLAKGIDFPEVELGWMLYQGHEGRGFATEAARSLRDWAFGAQGLAMLVSYIDPPNARSIAVARRLGAVQDPGAERPTATDLVFRHPRVLP
jgi:RimJ/RimL family protein N-acetyltransferase